MVTKKPKKDCVAKGFDNVWIDGWWLDREKMGDTRKKTIDGEGYVVGKDEMELMIKINKLIDEYECPNGSYERTIGCEISFIDTNTDIMHNYSYNGENFVTVGRKT
jgi:hypothetical protein